MLASLGLRFCRRRGMGMAGYCWLYCRLRLCRRRGRGMASSCWLHCRLRMCRGRGRGCDGFMLASLEAEVV